jgi:hypothetical protein
VDTNKQGVWWEVAGEEEEEEAEKLHDFQKFYF